MNDLCEIMLRDTSSELFKMSLAARRTYKEKSKNFVKVPQGEKVNSKTLFFAKIFEDTKDSLSKSMENDRLRLLNKKVVVGIGERVSFKETTNEFAAERLSFLATLSK